MVEFEFGGTDTDTRTVNCKTPFSMKLGGSFLKVVQRDDLLIILYNTHEVSFMVLDIRTGHRLTVDTTLTTFVSPARYQGGCD